MKCVSIVALLVLLVVLRRPSDYRSLFIAFLIWAGATVVLVQAARTGKYFWMAAFIAVAVFFNPIVPISVSRNLLLAVDVFSLALFIGALAALKTSPKFIHRFDNGSYARKRVALKGLTRSA